ncbi:3-oxoacyl-ACP synthase [Spirulina subsalsa FACHB-351]|uniref:3-oxoacyl-ACP synthase n=1 Tax=Spirulina subsalsa FACHB-351 TaxID=234711 RepID=A0ABT3L5Y3_9CYAN|nr:3-oxoacyl-[acyl-carrier-protein] synthase III C-terminal domain-containing protein [Spirulina subsalsa]MCW6036906.1 3-oxoacyl-ACP synthase [Spirulina subsalsa FACHB-351]
MESAYITSIGKFLPGEPIGNDEMESYLGRIGDRASKVRHRILKSNGIQQRYYAIDLQQKTRYQNSEMAAFAVRDALSYLNLEPHAIDLLACSTTLPDLTVPGFASMVHGELTEFSPLEAISLQGVCCAGVAALNYASSQVQLGKRRNTIAVASELASRLFKSGHFEADQRYKNGEKVAFDTEFLRWMLSDGAGAFVIQNTPASEQISLRVDWIELISHAHHYPVCMYGGTANESAQKSWLDYPSYAEAVQEGAFHLRQDIRRLDEVIKLGVTGWLKLIEAGRVKPEEIDWLLCHYSSHFFRSKIVDFLEKANCMIPEEKWFTNLYTRGNTGCASIYLMLEELFHSGKLQPGEKIFCFVPESGRYTTAYMMLTVVERNALSGIREGEKQAVVNAPQLRLNRENEAVKNSVAADLLRQLTLVWLDFEQQLHGVSLIRKLERGDFTREDYKLLLRNLRPQVVEGARWIARAASNMLDFRLRSLFIGHAQDEHRDYQMLERNYVSVGGELSEIVNSPKNIGSQALSAFIFHQASQENPLDLLGSMFIIEGLGNRLAGKWAKQIKATLKLTDDQVSFLAYHGENDESHLGKLEAILNADWLTAEMAQKIVNTARVTARLYQLQLEEMR